MLQKAFPARKFFVKEWSDSRLCPKRSSFHHAWHKKWRKSVLPEKAPVTFFYHWRELPDIRQLTSTFQEEIDENMHQKFYRTKTPKGGVQW
jgi:hypothetical protein